MGHDRRLGGKHAIQQAFVKAGGIKRGVAGMDDAAIVGVSPKLAFLPLPWDEKVIAFQPCRPEVQLLRQLIIGRLTVGGVKSTANSEAAIDPLCHDEIAEPLERAASLRENGAGACFAVARYEFVEVGLDTGTDLAAVPRAAAPTNCLGIDDDRRPAGARQLKRRAKAGISRADHKDIGNRRQPVSGNVPGWHGVMPVTGRREIGGEKRAVAHGQFPIPLGSEVGE